MAVNSNAPIQFTFSGLPGGDGYCFTTPQRFALDITANLSGYIPGQYSTLIISESEPAVADRDRVWFQLNVGGAPSGKFFIFSGGVWQMPNAEEPGSPARRFLVGATAADVWAYDGGDGTDPSSNPPSDTSGAMWEVDSTMEGRFPLGAGTLSPSGTIVAAGATGGADEVELTGAQNGPHTHEPLSPSTSFVCGGGTLIVGMGSTPAASSAATTGSSGDGDPHANMPPYLVGLWCKRTARVSYTP